MRKVLLIATVLTFVLAGSAWAFHDQGVADCQGCHTMHNSQDGILVDPDSPDGNDWLLKDATPSDVCLSVQGASSIVERIVSIRSGSVTRMPTALPFDGLSSSNATLLTSGVPAYG